MMYHFFTREAAFKTFSVLFCRRLKYAGDCTYLIFPAYKSLTGRKVHNRTQWL